MEDIDNPNKVFEFRKIIQRRPFLREFYNESYRKYVACLERCPREGYILELGSGAGFAAKVIPSLIASDILLYEGVDCVIDARELPFPDLSIRLICMMNVFHHIHDVEAFLFDAQRCLIPGGRLFIIDQHVGFISKPILGYLHHELFQPDVEEWTFEINRPLSGANGALAWMVFLRDRESFESNFKQLKLVRYQPHTPLSYWLSGGLHGWNLLPQAMTGPARRFDRFLMRVSSDLGSFVDIEVVKEV